MDTDTPDTEAHYKGIVDEGQRATGRAPDFMRKLERERDTFRTALTETVQHLTDCQAMLDDTLELADCCPDTHTSERKAHIAKWRNILAPGSNHPLV